MRLLIDESVDWQIAYTIVTVGVIRIRQTL